MTKEQLLDTYTQTGTSVEEFRDILDQINKATYIVKAETHDLQLFSLLKIDEHDGVIEFLLYDYEQSVKNEPPKLAKIEIGQLEVLLGAEGYEEFTKRTRFLLFHKGAMYIPSKSAFSGLAARADLGGSGACDPSHELFALLARRYEREPQKTKMVVRSGDGINKLIACMSRKYGYVPQDFVCEIMDGFAADMGCKPLCKGWEVTQSYTSISFEFPEKSEDFAKTYELDKQITPGITLCTSDTGDASFSATGFYRIGNSPRRIPCDLYRRKHTSKVDMTEIRRAIKTTIFERYIMLPQKLCELIAIPVEKPKDVTELILDQIGFWEKAGKRIGRRLSEMVISEYSEAFPYTAYNVAMTILSIPDRFTDGADSTLRKIEAVVHSAVYADYHKANRQADIYVSEAA